MAQIYDDQTKEINSEMPVLRNDRFLKALFREPVDKTPVWLMRQAGRYLPEYREVRSEAGDFMSLCKNPKLACEVTLQPLRRYELDAAILFSDILTIPDAMGQGLYFVEGEGPKFRKVIRTGKDVEKIPDVNISRDLTYVTDAVSLIRRELDGSVPLIGFAGSPWTLATYMIEGGSSKDFREAKQFLYNHPTDMHLLLEKLTVVIVDYLNAQITAGAQAVQIFDTWGGLLTSAAYQEFSLKYMRKIIKKLRRQSEGRAVPVIIFTKGGGQWLELQAESGATALGLDWSTEIGRARGRVGTKVALQGNLDPSILYATEEVIRSEIGSILSSFGAGEGHIFNLGHGITPGVPPENVGIFVEAVHELSAQYHDENT